MQKFFFGQMISKFSTLLLVTMLIALTGCGSGAPTGTLAASGVGAAATLASTVQLLVSSQQLLSSQIASTTLTAVVVDATGQAMSGKIVTFSKGTDSTAYFTNITAITGTNGVATATLNIGTNMANRLISVLATADAAIGTNSVTVTGTKIAISGNTSLALNASTTLTIILKDSTGAPVQGVALAVASQNSNPIVLTPSTGITDSTGQITATITANNAGAGTDVLTVTGAGVSQTQTLTINSSSFTFIAPTIVPPATAPEITVNTATPVTVHWLNGVTPVSGATVNFYTSRGTFASSGVAVTNGSGDATLNITAGSTGATIITASGAGGSPAATLNVVLITNSASSVAAQANPGTVAVNTGSSTANQSVISVVVRDVNNNLVKNAHVTFSQVTDATGGTLAAAAATTDITGTTSVNYIAGTISSGQNGVQIRATVDTVNGVAIPQISTTVNLTVASQALFVRLGTDNKIYSDTVSLGTYSKKYTALVTDSGGNPAADGTQVRFVLRPAKLSMFSFFKGRWIPGMTTWIKDTSVGVGCINEDANLDGILQGAEDTNGNHSLDPLGVATVNATATTISGFATATITYAKQYAYWVQDELEARAGTVGNDPPAVVTLLLPGAAADYADVNVPPPGQFSPYGVGDPALGNAVCTNTQ